MQTGRTRAPASRTTMEDLRILIVDDSSVMRSSLRKMVAPISQSVVVAENGDEGLAVALNNGIDLILSDVDMPALDGIEMCRRLRQNESTRSKPVILLSSFDSDQDIERGFRAGATAYLSKTAGPERILKTVMEVLQRTNRLRGQSILVVDDSPTIRDVVSDGLREAGFAVEKANGGSDALRRLQSDRPDLILSDIEMPGIDGFELCRHVRTSPELREIPFIVMSSLTDRGVMKRMLQDGASAYICKPFNLDELIILVERILSDRLRLVLKEKEQLDNERRLMIESISGLVSALEARDPYTRGHSEAVGHMVGEMVRSTGRSADEVERAQLGGRLHDIGKIGVPDSVLLKPGKLTDNEFLMVKEHPRIGARILRDIQSLSDINEIVLHHHERFDGRGYPDGLEGERIPMLARMTAVADTFHALTSDRPYRKGMPVQQAVAILKEVRGTQLCPECVNLFLDLLEHWPGAAGGIAGLDRSNRFLLPTGPKTNVIGLP